MTSPLTSIERYQKLLEFFSGRTSDEQPIRHPDSDINRTAQRDRESYRSAAVLIPITRLCANNKSYIVLTVRSENLRSHAGQISLPGGTTEPEDNNEIHTALRESNEEIGLIPHQVEVLGKLGEMALPSGFRVTPVVGLIENNLAYAANPAEVADIFQVPLDLALNPDAYTRTSWENRNQQRAILELHYEDYRIWGATAAILHHLARRIGND
jgi:8-oxo-dGTP pyrophosphatase MutT (NUDIX family)